MPHGGVPAWLLPHDAWLTVHGLAVPLLLHCHLTHWHLLVYTVLLLLLLLHRHL